MTLPSSGSITVAQIATEVGGFPFSIPSTPIRDLTGRPSGPITAPNDFYGQTGGGIVTELGTFSANTVAAVATFAGCGIGNSAWNRRVFALVHWACNTSAVETTISSATIGGVAASLHINYGEGGSSAFSNYGCAIISATVPTGTTATIVVNLTSGAAHSVYISVYRVTGLVSTIATDAVAAFDDGAATFGGGTLSATASNVLFPVNGVGFFAATASSDGVFGNFSSTTITELQEQDMTLGGHLINGMRRLSGAPTNFNVTVSGTVTVRGRLRLVTATFAVK